MILTRPYTGIPSPRRPASPPPLPALNLERMADPAGYLPDEGLVDAVNVALMLRQPLLLTGEPGTGKTQLAFSVAWELGMDAPLAFETKSTSVSRDLFYSFDNLRRFQVAHAGGADLDPRAFIEYNAMGLAILRTLEPAEAARVAPPGYRPEPPRRSVVLIDEVDKAPRDFPNDILNELDTLGFRIPELGGRVVRADSALAPIVIITSNSEKSLPDPFLRRCIFYHIPFPDEERLEQIVLARIGTLSDGAGGVVTEVLDFFSRLRGEPAGMRKRPGTAELLNWSTALVGAGVDPAQPLRAQAGVAVRTVSTLAKHPEDYINVVRLFKAWAHE